MPDSTDYVYHSKSQLLGKAIDLATEKEILWGPNELGAVLKHQLSAPVGPDLTRRYPRQARQIRDWVASCQPPIESFRDLFGHPDPPLGLLALVKEFAKTSTDHPDSPLPLETAQVLYSASIVVARVRTGNRITQLDDEALRYNLTWALAQPWLVPELRAIFRAGLETLDAGCERAGSP